MMLADPAGRQQQPASSGSSSRRQQQLALHARRVSFPLPALHRPPPSATQASLSSPRFSSYALRPAQRASAQAAGHLAAPAGAQRMAAPLCRRPRRRPLHTDGKEGAAQGYVAGRTAAGEAGHVLFRQLPASCSNKKLSVSLIVTALILRQQTALQRHSHHPRRLPAGDACLPPVAGAPAAAATGASAARSSGRPTRTPGSSTSMARACRRAGSPCRSERRGKGGGHSWHQTGAATGGASVRMQAG